MSSYSYSALAIRGIPFLPNTIRNVVFGKKISEKIITKALTYYNGYLVLLFQKDVADKLPKIDGFYDYGVLAKIVGKPKKNQDNINVVFEPIEFVDINSLFRKKNGHIVGKFSTINFNISHNIETLAKLSIIKENFTKYIKLTHPDLSTILKNVFSIEDDLFQIFSILNLLNLSLTEVDYFIKKRSTTYLLDFTITKLLKNIEIEEAKEQIEQNVKKSIEQTQRNVFLMEQLKAIKSELGMHQDDEIETFKNRLDNIKSINDKYKKILKKEIDKLETYSKQSPEYMVHYNYLSLVLELPWDSQNDNLQKLDFKKAIKVLDDSHYGMDKTKNRIIEYLSILKLTGRISKTILCLVGPPGCGKTSIARSVALSLNREFARMSLGGLHDESEIRGHRKTYIGAMPGQIIRKIKEVGVKNPVFLLDEIDKIGNDYRGDPYHALLEVLDPEQNKEFHDNYVEIPFDLGEVMFITTANSLSSIPRPLLDRMEIVEVSSYLIDEKVAIAKKYLIKRAIDELGLKDIVKINIPTTVIKFIITRYTRESGVRQLNRLIHRILKNVAKSVLLEELNKISIAKDVVKQFLGKELYQKTDIIKHNEVGIVTGLAWTEVGGDILFVQTNIYKSNKESLILTGRMGEVMRESAKIAISVVKTILDEIDKMDRIKDREIHVHIPHQSVPKEGPSAGVALVTSILSATLEIKVNRFLAMTGEVNLRGDVLPIGGLREKLTAAKNSGIKTVCIPNSNKKDIEELDPKVIDGLEIIPVTHVKEIFPIAYKKDIFKNK